MDTRLREHSAAAFLPHRLSLPMLREAAAVCRGCDLYKRATQTVFGEGARSAQLMLVGEQPGDEEDKAGQPFVGPAGRLLDAVLDEVQIDRKLVYVTNAVKHFKWKPAPGARKRMHDKPSAGQIRACFPWLEAELKVVQPHLVVALGASAAQALLGAKFRLTKHRGEILTPEAFPPTMATYHPSAILRAPDRDARARMREQFKADLLVAAQSLHQGAARRNN